MTDVSPAEELRRAAARIRAVAGKATPGPWVNLDQGDRIIHVTDANDPWGFAYVVDEPLESHPENGDQIALWDPIVAVLVAAWLEHTGDNMADENAYVVEKPRVDGTTYSDVELDGYSHTGVTSEWSAALDLARAINGSADV